MLVALPQSPELRRPDRYPQAARAARDRVLERFYRLDRSRSLPGNGLGLSRVSAIVALHGGRLVLDEGDFEIEPLVQSVCDMMAPRAFAKGLDIGFYVAPGTPASATVGTSGMAAARSVPAIAIARTCPPVTCAEMT